MSSLCLSSVRLSSLRLFCLAVPLSLLAGCAARTPAAGASQPIAGTRAFAGLAPDAHSPDFARRPFVPFNRVDAIAIALREWRLFGQPVDDDPPDTRPVPPPDLKPEREPGLWERVGEYWWLGIDADQSQSAWTGKQDEYGTEFPAGQDANFAWSAAFISYVMRTAGAGARFPYAISHAHYINAARQMSLNQTTGWVVSAERPENYPVKPGDVICMGRGRASRLKFDDLPTAGGFAGHCDIVVTAAPGMLSVIGGNVDDAVTMKHVPVTPDGMLATSDGVPVDTRYPWFVVLRVIYDQENETAAPAVVSMN